MKRTNLNFIIDVIAFVGFVMLTTTGVLMRYILPPGSGHYSTIWSLDRHEWGGIHFWISISFFSVLALHLVLHWRWIVCVITGRPRENSGFRVGLGIVGLLATVALAMSPLLAPVKKDFTSKEALFISSHKYEGIVIRGSMTLKNVEETTGVPASYIIESLKLSQSISAEQQLGPLKRIYGVEINDVREIVKEYKNRK
ncbi:MAG: DUF4405 domain-containing protein [Methylococcales bacterium]|nr:DUF4405 domain-containing protein [Methylococcales bacterium]